MVDQSDTTPDGSGTLYIYDGASINGQAAHKAVPEVIDLGGLARDLCLTTGSAGRRPHMLFFNAAHTHAILSYVSTGHVLFIDGATRTPVGCVDVGLQSHAAFPSQDGTFVLVANQNGKLLQRINTDYATNTFTLDNAATLDLANGTTPAGALRQDPALRPDNAPICLGIDASSRYGFVTLRGGGLFVVDCATTPMQIVAEYDLATIHPTGCVAVQVGNKMYIVSGTGADTQAQTHADLYVLPINGFSPTPNPPNIPAPQWVLSEDGAAVDAHGAVPTKHGNYLWMVDRFANKITVVDTTTDRVVNRFNIGVPLVNRLSLGGPGQSGDPAPDLMDISPSGNRIFATLRGPRPLTGNNPGFNNAVGNTPGLGIFQVKQGGRSGAFVGIAPISHTADANGNLDGIEHADPHAIAVRRK
jgi:DNA-binding beta-propeller fold protein YncE